MTGKNKNFKLYLNVKYLKNGGSEIFRKQCQHFAQAING